MSYEAPAVTSVGSFDEVTQVINKNYSPTNDGYTFQHQNVNVS